MFPQVSATVMSQEKFFPGHYSPPQELSKCFSSTFTVSQIVSRDGIYRMRKVMLELRPDGAPFYTLTSSEFGISWALGLNHLWMLKDDCLAVTGCHMLVWMGGCRTWGCLGVARELMYTDTLHLWQVILTPCYSLLECTGDYISHHISP